MEQEPVLSQETHECAGQASDATDVEVGTESLSLGGQLFVWSVDVTVGKHRVAWGRVDGIGTIDRINAVDFREPIENARTSSRRPSWLVRVQQRTAIGIFEAVWLPRGRDRKFPEAGSPWETAAQRSLRELSGHSRYAGGTDWRLGAAFSRLALGTGNAWDW